MKNTEEIEIINALKTIKNYCSKRDSAGDCFCCMMFGFCNKYFTSSPFLWDIKNPYENKNE